MARQAATPPPPRRHHALGAAAGYETYMHFVWEPTVHAPIRLDVFVLELPLMLLGVVLGVCSMIGRRAPPG